MQQPKGGPQLATVVEHKDSKSFISFLSLIVKCILYPGAMLFTTTAGKQQAANIATEKINELMKLIPALKKEVDWTKTSFSKDMVKVVFHNGSQLDVMAAQQTTRGARRHGGLMEEAVLIDGQVLNEVILPTLNVSRRCANGEVDPNDALNKSQSYITTSGWRNTFAYQKVLQLLIWQLIKPGKAISMGGTWRVPVYCGLLDKNFLRDIREDETFSEESFEREYESVWSGSSAGAFFDADAIEKSRKVEEPEYEHNSKNKNNYYVISVDVARTKSCQTAIAVFKVEPQPYGSSIKKLVNIYTYEEEHFGFQALRLKQLYEKYQPKQIVIDANGLGVGLIDFMVIPTIDPETGETYPGFTPSNDESGLYKRFEQAEGVIKNSIFMIKANAQLNTVMHSNVSIQMRAGKIHLLADERIKKAELLASSRGAAMSQAERAEYLRPFSLTGILKEEMLNLREENEGVNIILKRESNKLTKDKFSAFEMGLYYVKYIEDTGKKRKKFSVSEMMFIN